MVKLDIIKPTGIKFSEPSMLSAKLKPEDTENSYLELFGEARKYIYGNLKLSQSLSNQVWNISEKAWTEIISAKLVDENDEPTLELNKEDLSYAIIGDNKLVSITESPTISSNWNKFSKIIEDLKTNCLINVEDVFNEDDILQKIIITKELEDKPYLSLNIIELDFKWGYFVVYSGIKYKEDGIIVLSKKPSLIKQRLGEFLEALDLDNEISLSEKMSLLVAKDFETSEKLISKVSVRELLDILKFARVKIDFETDKGTEGKVLKAVGLQDEDNERICEMLNSFKIPFKSLTKLSNLKKSFKQEDLNFYEILKILSRYVSNTVLNVNGRLLTVVAQALLSKDYDQAVIKTEIESSNIK